MKSGQIYFRLLAALLVWGVSPLFSADKPVMPVTPGASAEARALLDLLYSTSGKYTFTGQHNYPNVKDRNTQFAADYIGETPAVWSTDMGFAEDGDTDSYLARPDIVEEAKRQHQLGSIITLCWHAVPPTAKEPVTFRPLPGADPKSLASVQGQLLDEQFKDVLTPGTALYKQWTAQVDSVAFYLRKLMAARIPVLWRPYHEMNGGWFWWGGRTGKYSTKALYRQIFNRLVKHHKLNNLIWVWSVDRPNRPEMAFSSFYPGNEYLDVVAMDVYGGDFNQTYYDSLVVLSKGKPLVLGEVGNPPPLEILDKQPGWGFWVIWAGMVRNLSKKQHDILISDPRILSQEDPAFWEVMAPFRKACGLPLLPLKSEGPPDFSGNWIFNEEKSVLDNFGTGNLPYKMEILQKDNELAVTKSFIVEWGDDRVAQETLTLDGSEVHSEFMNFPRITTATWSAGGDTLILISRSTFTRGDRTIEMVTKEEWSLIKRGKILAIKQSSTAFRGERIITMIFDKQ